MAECNEYDDARKLAVNAGLSLKEGLVQKIYFSELIHETAPDFVLAELPDDVLDYLQRGEALHIRGKLEDDAVMCTDSRTFDIRSADTSNTLLLVPSVVIPAKNRAASVRVDRVDVVGRFSGVLEIRETRPRIARLKAMLRSCLYAGEADESPALGFPIGRLLDEVQCSEQELLRSLNALGALQIGSVWRALDPDYSGRCSTMLLALLDEKAWSHTQVPVQESVALLSGLFPQLVVRHCMRQLTESCQFGSHAEKEFALYSERKVCRCLAESILRSVGRMAYKDFMESWQDSLPYGMSVRAEYLYGIALMETVAGKDVITYRSVQDLPEDLPARLRTLFRSKPSWLEREIQPYLEDLLLEGQSLNSLLLKYVTVTKNVHGETTYAAKASFTCTSNDT